MSIILIMMQALEVGGSPRPLEARDKAHFWRDARFDGLECLSATFHTLQFAPHSHETFCIGAMEAGIQKWRISGQANDAGTGDFYLINPDVIHEGRPDEAGYRYRMIYPSVELLTELLEDAGECHISGTPSFNVHNTSNLELAREFLALHRQMEAGVDRLQTESRFFNLIVRLFHLYGAQKLQAKEYKARKAVHIARDYLAAHFSEDVSLAEVSSAAGLSRAHLIRAFKAEFHLPPHAWLTDRRIREARRLLSDGASIADTAFDCGFADQAHFTRHFKARTGVTPAVFCHGRL